MATYYIDSSAAPGEDGLSERSPLPTWKGLDIRSGDCIHLKRGSVFHDSILSPPNVLWHDYGEGEKPIITSSQDLLTDEWELVEEHIYRYGGTIPSEVCNLWFGEDSFGILKYSYAELERQGDFFYTGIGLSNNGGLGDPAAHSLYLWSEKPPKEVYTTLWASLYGDRALAKAQSGDVFWGLSFFIGGVHGIAGTDCKKVSIFCCDFFGIGGAVWNKERRIRFGNGVEFWHNARNVSLTHCRFDQIYDSCFTHQGCTPDATPDGITVRGNHFQRYGMAAYEIRDRITTNTLFCDNLCEYAGEGFSTGEGDRPRNSEIYPRPMGHHIFIWRITEPTENGAIHIAGNRFGSADHGHAVYSLACPEGEAQFSFDLNRFAVSRVYWGGREDTAAVLP